MSLRGINTLLVLKNSTESELKEICAYCETIRASDSNCCSCGGNKFHKKRLKNE